MLRPEDFIRLPYTSDLTEGGIAYACRSLPHTYNRMGGTNAKRLRRIVGGIAVELAFRRYLHEQGIAFDVKGATPFTDPDKYDVALGGHRCDIKSFFISRKAQIASLKRDWSLLLDASALIPSDQFLSSSQRESDIYIFAFLTGLFAASRAEMSKAKKADLPLFLIHPMPPSWATPLAWRSFGKIAVKSNASRTLTVELGGQNAQRQFISKKIRLKPRQRVEVDSDFYTLAYIHVNDLPDAQVGLSAFRYAQPYIIASSDWKNIWVYGMQIVLAGYLTRKLFRRKARELPVGSRVFQYRRTRTKNLAVPVAELQPLSSLLEKAKDWRRP